MRDRGRRFVVLCLGIVFVAVATRAGAAPDPRKVLRLALPDVTNLDPQQLTDLYSSRVANAIFEGLYQYDYLASPARIVPNTAIALPEIGEGGRVWTIRVQPGIHFSPHAAFKGMPRELVAADYVYSIKRWLDPNLKLGGEPTLTDLIAGARGVVDAARKPGARFDYDAPIAGLRAIDRHTLRIELTAVDYTLLERLARVQTFAVAREVVESAEPTTTPVGTGPYRLVEWKRGSRLALEAHRGYRAIAFPADAPAAQRHLIEEMRGVALPAIGRIEVAIIEEDVPELLSFERGELDYTLMTRRTAARLLERGTLAPAYAKRGIRHTPYTVPALIYTYFNMEDAVVGGTSQERIALRRAIGLAFDTQSMIRVMFGGDALPASQMLPPGVEGHDPSIPARAAHDPTAARALLDRFGYRDRDGDGWRETPDGAALALNMSLTPDSTSRELGALWIASMKAIGVRITVNTAPFAELLKQSLAGQLQMFGLGYRAESPSGYSIMALQWGKAPPDTNRSRFRNADYDAAYEAFLRTPPGPERNAIARRMSDIVQAHAPITYHLYPLAHAFAQPWVKGFHPSTYGFSWKYLDLDLARRAAKR